MQRYSCQEFFHRILRSRICILPETEMQEQDQSKHAFRNKISVSKTYRVKPVTVPNPFTVKRNNQRPVCDPRLGVFSKQRKPAGIVPESNQPITYTRTRRNKEVE
ncbi:hypothetical protein Hanom_Chr14g01300211 [Helianthus anomalus]